MRKFTENWNEDEVFHLNIGVPLVISFFLLLANLILFEVKFLEAYNKLIIVYTYSSLLVIAVLLIFSKSEKKKEFYPFLCMICLCIMHCLRLFF